MHPSSSCHPYSCRTCSRLATTSQAYRELAKRHPSFRERSETRDLIVEISLQPWNSFRPDGVILFRYLGHLQHTHCADHIIVVGPICGTPSCLYTCSDILTPLPALGMPFEIDDLKGPIIEQPIRCAHLFSQQPAAPSCE